MAACARADLADPREVAVFHIWNRVVRRALLCGIDPLSKKNFDYRRDWVADQERLLARLFGIDIGFHAEMANHIHLVVRTRPDIVATWSDEEVIRRWLSITKLTRSFENVIVLPDAARVRMKAANPEYVAAVRLRLSSISSFMAALSENIARRANTEDGVSGRFWENRFGAQVHRRGRRDRLRHLCRSESDPRLRGSNSRAVDSHFGLRSHRPGWSTADGNTGYGREPPSSLRVPVGCVR